jgi:hypothetical protein
METSKSKHDDNYQVFEIRDRSDISHMQSTLNKEDCPHDKRFIALELAENMVNAHAEGEILINGVEVINVVTAGVNRTKVDEVNHYLGKAKHMLDNHIPGKVKTDPSRKFGGKGLLTILSAGWDVNVVPEQDYRGMKIVATRTTDRHSIPEVAYS